MRALPWPHGPPKGNRARQSVGKHVSGGTKREPSTHMMMKIKAQRIRDARAFTTYIGNSILIMENSDLGGCETLETPNIFLFPSVLSFITILIRSCFYFRKIYSPSQSRSYFI